MKNPTFFILTLVSLYLKCECKQIVYQPQFRWSDGTCTQQGTGSFIRGPKGKILGLTSAHFINFSGPQLLEIDWLDMRTKNSIATSMKSWGMPGREGSYHPLDLRSDYLLTIVEGTIDPQNILELDEGNSIAGERVWFPNKTPLGCELIEGSITEVAETHLLVTLDTTIDLQSRSGTPIISQNSGKVVGILTGGGNHLLYLAPSSNIYKAMVEAHSFPLLKDVIGSNPTSSEK